MYRNPTGRQRKLTLGAYGEITVDEARKLAKRRMLEISQGVDPVEEEKARRGAMTVAELCDEYLDRGRAGLILTKRGKPKANSTFDEDKYRIDAHIIPLIGNRTINEIDTADAARLVREITVGSHKERVRKLKTKSGKIRKAQTRGGPGIAARTAGMIGSIFSYAVQEGYIPTNPFAGVRKPAGNCRTWRLDDDGYRALGAVLAKAEQEGAAWQFVAVVRACAMTGARLREIEGLRKSDVDLKGKALRLAQTKTGASIRPLGGAAIEIIREAMARSDSEYVFHSITNPAKPHIATTPWLRKNAGEACPGITSHGFRHSFASMANDLGFVLPTIKVMLGHSVPGGVTGGYIHHLDSSLIAAADKVSRHIDNLMRGKSEVGGDNVIPFDTISK